MVVYFFMTSSNVICNDCGQKYLLEEGQNPEDFECECGGNLKIILENFPEKKDTKSKNVKRKRRMPKPDYGRILCCADCGTENVNNSKFCIKCGKNLKEKILGVCYRCGTKNESKAEFCKECGIKLEDDKIASKQNFPSKDTYNTSKDYNSLNLGEIILITFFSPIAGIIGYIVWKDDKPKKAEQAGLIGVVIFIIIIIILL